MLCVPERSGFTAKAQIDVYPEVKLQKMSNCVVNTAMPKLKDEINFLSAGIAPLSAALSGTVPSAISCNDPCARESITKRKGHKMHHLEWPRVVSSFLIFLTHVAWQLRTVLYT